MKRCPENWKDYALIDSGGGKKLERFGKYVLIRPEPKAFWLSNLKPAEWENKAHAEFIQRSSNSGEWKKFKPMNEEWPLNFSIDNKTFTFSLRLTKFKHVGVFPEQAVNWELISSKLNPNSKFLNLFAYTGAASIVAKSSGADVYHVDSIKQVISWSKQNMEHSGLDNIRWVLEDALKFAQREEKRGNKYDFILMDPPSFGHGPKGEKWQLSEKINPLLKACSSILNSDGCLVWNNYSLGLSEMAIENLLKQHFTGKKTRLGELYIKDSFDKNLPMGVFGIIE